MEIEEVRQKAREDAENLWKNELESLFSEKINESLLDLMKNIDSKFINYEKQLNASIKESNKNSMLDSSSNISNNQVLNPKKIDITKINKMYVKLILSDDINPLINLIIQCLTNIKTFCAYYLNPQREEKILSKSRKNPNGFYLGPAYLKLLKDIWGDQRGEYSPIEIHNILKKLMENDYNSNNSGSIMKFILNQLYLELNLDNNQLINLENVKDLNNLPNNKILNASYSYIGTKKFCLFCKKTFDKYYIVSPVINIYLDANNGKSNKFNLENNLNELLIERGKGKIIDNCFICNRQQDINIIKYISTPSEITIFYIDRKNDPNHNISLSYGFSMILSKIEYKLITVIKCLPSYKDVSCPYIAYIRSFNNHNWYSYDNKNIKLCNNENEILEDKYASLLIYSPPKST